MLTDRSCERCERCVGEGSLQEAAVAAASDDGARGVETQAEAFISELRGRPTCSVDQAAKALCIGRSTAYAAARDGSLPTFRISNRILVPTAKLLALLGLEDAA